MTGGTDTCLHGSLGTALQTAPPSAPPPSSIQLTILTYVTTTPSSFPVCPRESLGVWDEREGALSGAVVLQTCWKGALVSVGVEGQGW